MNFCVDCFFYCCIGSNPFLNESNHSSLNEIEDNSLSVTYASELVLWDERKLFNARDMYISAIPLLDQEDVIIREVEIELISSSIPERINVCEIISFSPSISITDRPHFSYSYPLTLLL